MSIIQGHAKSSGVSAFYTKTIDQSLRFNDADLPHLFWEPNDTPDGGGQKFTISFWMKRADLANYQTIYAARNGATAADYWIIGLTPDKLYIQGGYGANMNLTPTQVLRDPSAWYHIVVAADTTLATANDRVKLYINGEQVTDFSTRTNPTQNYDLKVLSTTVDQYIGRVAAQQYFDGYLAEFIVVDNQQLDPTSFGELKSGIWIAKEYSGSYGQGTHLDFADSASIGNDISGNNHDWTVNNLVASDVVPDSPTNNFATLSPLLKTSTSLLREGNLLHQSNASEYRSAASTFLIPPNSGKWYWEVYADTTGVIAGIIEGQPKNTFGVAGYYIGYNDNEYSKFNQYKVTNAGFSTLWGTSATTGDVVGFLLDTDNGDLFTYLNGTIEESGTAMFSGLSSETGYIPALSSYNSQQIVNFGQDSTFAGDKTAGGNTDANGIGDFLYAVPTDAKALCTSNLPDPVIDPAQNTTSEDYINVVTYTGNGTAIGSGGNAITGVGFQPDWVWIKERNGVASHGWYDVVRSTTKQLESDQTAVETTESEGVTTFGTDGFTVGSLAQVNTNTDSYVAWNWKAGGTGVSNTNGSITSTVSANTDAGFSIVGYTGTQVAGDSVGHGLSQAPEMIIVKKRGGAASDWSIYHKDLNVNADNLPETDFLEFDTNSAADSSAEWNDQAPTSSVFYLGNGTQTNDGGGGGIDHVAYCFHSVDQYCKIGSYIGNSQANGTFVYTGFRPKWIMVKSTVEVSAPYTGWCIIDAERMSYNANSQGTQLWANAAYSEGKRGNGTTATQPGDFDILSNGFKLRTNYVEVNYSGQQYIYIAFAEQPFKYSNAR